MIYLGDMAASGQADPELDPALATLDTDLRNLHRRAELLAAHHDPRTIPQGVGDAIHDAVVALADARTVLAGVLL